MPRVPLQAPSAATPSTSTDFESIFRAALDAYRVWTKKDIPSHPLATQLESCNSSSAVLSVLRAQVQAFDRSQSADDKWTKWLDPTVNVLYAFSTTLGNGVGVVSDDTLSRLRATLTCVITGIPASECYFCRNRRPSSSEYHPFPRICALVTYHMPIRPFKMFEPARMLS